MTKSCYIRLGRGGHPVPRVICVQGAEFGAMAGEKKVLNIFSGAIMISLSTGI